MLLDDFFTIRNMETREGSTVHFSVELNPLHRIYEGHFPGNPVVPGVCQTGMIRECMEVFTSERLFIRAADQIKFLKMINPSETPRLDMDITLKPAGSGEQQISATLYHDSVTFLKFKGTLCTKPR